MLIEPEDDEEENFKDVPEINGDIVESGKVDTVKVKVEKSVEEEGYDGKKRDPLFAKADQSCLWELVSLLPTYLLISFLCEPLLPVTSSGSAEDIC